MRRLNFLFFILQIDFLETRWNWIIRLILRLVFKLNTLKVYYRLTCGLLSWLTREICAVVSLQDSCGSCLTLFKNISATAMPLNFRNLKILFKIANNFVSYETFSWIIASCDPFLGQLSERTLCYELFFLCMHARVVNKVNKLSSNYISKKEDSLHMEVKARDVCQGIGHINMWPRCSFYALLRPIDVFSKPFF